MKMTKLLSVFLVISMLACMFVACDMGGSTSDEDAPDLPEREERFYAKRAEVVEKLKSKLPDKKKASAK